MKELKKTNDRNFKLRAECDRLRNLLKKQMAETDKWRNLNTEMQTKIYEKMDEFGKNAKWFISVTMRTTVLTYFIYTISVAHSLMFRLCINSIT